MSLSIVEQNETVFYLVLGYFVTSENTGSCNYEFFGIPLKSVVYTDPDAHMKTTCLPYYQIAKDPSNEFTNFDMVSFIMCRAPVKPRKVKGKIVQSELEQETISLKASLIEAYKWLSNEDLGLETVAKFIDESILKIQNLLQLDNLNDKNREFLNLTLEYLKTRKSIYA